MHDAWTLFTLPTVPLSLIRVNPPPKEPTRPNHWAPPAQELEPRISSTETGANHKVMVRFLPKIAIN